jgi:putative copper export protein
MSFSGISGFITAVLLTSSIIYMYSNINGFVPWSTALELSLLIMLLLFMIALLLVVTWMNYQSDKEA